MENTPIDFNIVSQKIKESNLPSIGRASIREIVKLVSQIEQASEQKFIKMEMGVPGIPASKYGVEAEIEALKNGVAANYPPIQGIEILKKEISIFVKKFLDINVNSESCIPTVGSNQGSFASFLALSKYDKNKDTILFIDPGFPVQKEQVKVLGIKYETFDVYNYRGKKLKDKLEEYLKKGNICSLIYSNPNNPSWICFTDKELKIIGDLANKYDIIVVEDLAYFGMDFRKNYGRVGIPPFQPTVAKYTENYILLISASKIFSYAGQRIAMFVVSDKLFNRSYPDLKRFSTTDNFGHFIIYKAIYPLSSGTAHSVQYGLYGILKAANEGKYNFIEEIKEYQDKAKIMKKLFIDNNFYIVYDKDEGEEIADGFYFTFAYPNFTGEELLEKLLYYGISCISLAITGSERTEGLRACVSMVKKEQFNDLEYRLKEFNKHHKNKIVQ